MLPAAFVALSALPLTPNGKLDRKALPAPVLAPDNSPAPMNPQQQLLARLFAEILGVPGVGVEANFFDLGGDSIRSIQLVSRARKAGMTLAPRDIFQHRTVAALARVAAANAKNVAVNPPVSGGPLTAAAGPVPPTPIIAWWLEQGVPSSKVTQSLVLQVPADLKLPHLVDAVGALLDRHEVLRLRLRRSNSPYGWDLDIAQRQSIDVEQCVTRMDASGWSPEAHDQRIVEAIQAADAQVDLQSGRLVRVVWLDSGAGRRSRLLLVIHHLAVDSVSWRVLIPDLRAACEARAAGRAVSLDPVGTPFQQWTALLRKEAHSPTRVAELPLWRDILSRGDLLPGGKAYDRHLDTAATAATLSASLPTQTTAAVLGSVPTLLNVEVRDILLTAFALAICTWRRARGQHSRRVLILLQNHGREELPGTDLARTVGWLVNMFPVCLDLGDVDLDQAMAGLDSAGRALERVHNQLARLPSNGLGYGLLRYLNESTRAQLQGGAEPQFLFNYLGRFDQPQALDWTVAPGNHALWNNNTEAAPLGCALGVQAHTADCEQGPQLLAHWGWATRLVGEHDAHDLAQGWFAALESLRRHAESKSDSSARYSVVGERP
jgi:non-ribosomal peptide synthase protein (TIGR01720 family)